MAERSDKSLFTRNLTKHRSMSFFVRFGQAMKTIKNGLCSLVFCRQTLPQKVKIQSLSSSLTYNHCLDNLKMEPPGEHLLFQLQLNMCKRCHLTGIGANYLSSSKKNKCLYRYSNRIRGDVSTRILHLDTYTLASEGIDSS